MALRQQMLATGASTDEIVAEMCGRWSFRPREAYRHAHGWSQDAVAVRFTGIAGRLGSGLLSAERMPSTMVGTRIGEYERWPNGGRRPSPYVLTVLAEVYGTTLDRLLDAADLAGMPEPDLAVLAALGPPARLGQLRRQPGRVPAVAEHVRRRAAVLESSLLHASLLHGPAVHASSVHASSVHASSVYAPAEPAPAVPASLPETPERLGTGATPGTGATAGTPELLSVLSGQPGTRPSKVELRAATLDRAARDRDAAVLLSASAVEAAEFGEWAEVLEVGPSTLEQLDQDIRVIARDFLTQTPLPLLRRILHLRNRVFSLLERRHRPAQARELYLFAGRLCGLAAWLAGDLGHPAGGTTHARTGWLCADLADSPGLRGWMRATQSKLAYWEGRPRESAELAEDGLRLGVRDSGRPLLAGLAARAWAQCGEPAEARRSLRRAEAERAALTGEDEVGGIFACSEAQQYYLAGTTHMWLGEPRRAREAADRAVWLFELSDPRERFYGAESLAQIDSAIAQVTLGDVDGAAARLRSLLELPPSKRVDVIHQRVNDLERLLRDTGRPAPSSAARLADDIAEFRRAG